MKNTNYYLIVQKKIKIVSKLNSNQYCHLMHLDQFFSTDNTLLFIIEGIENDIST